MVTTLCGVMDRNVGPTSVVGAMDTETWIFGANQRSGFVFFFGTKWATLTPAQECLLLTFRDDFSTLQVAAEKYWTLDGFTVKLTQPSKTDLERTVSFCQKNILCRWGSLMAGPGCKRHYLYTVGVIRAWKKKSSSGLAKDILFGVKLDPKSFYSPVNLLWHSNRNSTIKTWYFP